MELFRCCVEEIVLCDRLIHLKHREAVLHRGIHDFPVINQLFDSSCRNLLNLQIFLQQTADAAVEIVADQRFDILRCLRHGDILIIQPHQRKSMPVLIVDNHPPFHTLQNINDLHDPFGGPPDP
ncbi:hypothetical protein D3C75_1153980 [compost metagenome]